jgi:hypothetical protein
LFSWNFLRENKSNGNILQGIKIIKRVIEMDIINTFSSGFKVILIITRLEIFWREIQELEIVSVCVGSVLFIFSQEYVVVVIFRMFEMHVI